jgi:hypothetical protein
MMMLEKLLAEKRPAVLKKWYEIILATYPDDTRKFLKSQKNRFANPVGQTISQGIEDIFQGLLHGIDTEETSAFLDNIIRIRAVQGFSPSQATAFIFDLKKVIRDEIGGEIRRQKTVLDEFLLLESRIDELGLLGFDIYMKCREKLYEIRANEMRRRTDRLLRKTDLFHELPEQGAESESPAYNNSE